MQKKYIFSKFIPSQKYLMFYSKLFGVFFFQHCAVFFIKLKELFFVHAGHYTAACEHSAMPAFANLPSFAFAKLARSYSYSRIAPLSGRNLRLLTEFVHGTNSHRLLLQNCTFIRSFAPRTYRVLLSQNSQNLIPIL